MNQANTQAIALPRTGTESVLATNRVIRNTYLLLSMPPPRPPGPWR